MATDAHPLRPEWIEMEEGLPRLQYDAVFDWLETLGADDRAGSEALNGVLHSWLERLATALGAGYRVAESAPVLLVSALDSSAAARTLETIERYRLGIVEALPEIAAYHEGVALVIVLLHSHEDFDAYVSPYLTDGAHERSGGFHLRSGFPHVVVLRSAHGTDQVLAHELSHAYLCHLELPLWVDEGVTASVEERVTGRPFLAGLDREQVSRHRAHWNADTIQGFWCGHSYHGRGDPRMLSYELGYALLGILSGEFEVGPDELALFLTHASREDAGASAAREHLGIELADVVSVFLGPGDWAPRPDAWGAIERDAYGDRDIDSPAYAYVGGELRESDDLPLGWVVHTRRDVDDWLREHCEDADDGVLTATYVVDATGQLLLAATSTSAADCAGGEPVRAAGMLTLALAPTVRVVHIANEDADYEPGPESWSAISGTLRRLGLEAPVGFGPASPFRRCPD